MLFKKYLGCRIFHIWWKDLNQGSFFGVKRMYVSFLGLSVEICASLEHLWSYYRLVYLSGIYQFLLYYCLLILSVLCFDPMSSSCVCCRTSLKKSKLWACHANQSWVEAFVRANQNGHTLCLAPGVGDTLRTDMAHANSKRQMRATHV
jgi:hypothetical protein